MMKVSNINAKFFIPERKEFSNHSSSFRSEILNNNYTVLSYNTALAIYYNDQWIINRTKYSVTTSKHQSIVAYALEGKAWEEAVLVYDIPRGFYFLQDVLEKNQIV